MYSTPILLLEDLFIYVLIAYGAFYLLRGAHRSSQKSETVQEEVESFKNTYTGQSLETSATPFQLTFPGSYHEIILRPWTLDPISKNIVDHLVLPMLQTLNQQEKSRLTLQSYSVIVCRQYQAGTIYTIEFFVQDPDKNITLQMETEVVTNASGMIHHNYFSQVSRGEVSTNGCSSPLPRTPVKNQSQCHPSLQRTDFNLNNEQRSLELRKLIPPKNSH